MKNSLRIDKWLWYARFFKSRTIATKFCVGGRLRVNNIIVKKAHYPISVGDVLTFSKGQCIRVVKIEKLGVRRGSAPEAQKLFVDLAPPIFINKRNLTSVSDVSSNKIAFRTPGMGRPTKADRRAIEKLTRH